MNVPTQVSENAVRVLKQFRVIFRSVKEHYRKVERVTGLSGSHVWALALIQEFKGIRPGELTERLAMHQSTASNIIRHLVSQGYVVRERNLDDARAFELTCTEKGRELLLRVPEPKAGVLVNALTEMPQASILQLEGHLDHVIARMGGSASEGDGLKPVGL
ncbi:MAG: MarR family winged helix-turn-helix transcriptional regulator [Burkholderiaceae bacterium]|jgi:DNA-binding MarR family transcriptional regulator